MTSIAQGYRRPRIFGGPTLFVCCQINQQCEALLGLTEKLTIGSLQVRRVHLLAKW